MTKICTSLEQSKKLIELGIDINTADMFYRNNGIDVKLMWEHNAPKVEYPCWSLAALLGIIPKHIENYNVLRIDISDNDFAIWYDEMGYGVNNDLPNITMESAIDACYEMICLLKENGKI